MTRAAEASSLGSLGDDTLNALVLPRPGAPEPIQGRGTLGGMGFPSGTPKGGLGAVDFSDPTTLIIFGAVGYVGYRWYKGRKKK